MFELATLYFEEEEPDWSAEETKIIKKAVDWWKVREWHSKIDNFLYKYRKSIYNKYEFDELGQKKETVNGLTISIFYKELDYMTKEDLNLINRINKIVMKLEDIEEDRLNRYLLNIVKYRGVLWS